MAALRIRRQATTPIGLDKRLNDMALDEVPDPRHSPNITYTLPALLKLILLSITSGAGAARAAHRRSRQLKPQQLHALGLPNAVAHNTISELLPRLSCYALNLANEAFIKAEKRRGNLNPSGGLPFHVVAIDGKCLMIYKWHHLVHLTRTTWRKIHKAHPIHVIHPPFDAQDREPHVFEVYCLLTCYFHDVQLVCPSQGLPYGKLMVHRATLVSTKAAVGLMQRSIYALTNEMGMLLSTLQSVLVAFGQTDLCSMFVMDAGNSCLKGADWLRAHRREYFMTIKANHGQLFKHAVEVLGDAEHPKRRADLTMREHRGGKDVLYRVWQTPLDKGFGAWTHARQLVRVERIVAGDQAADISVGNRYYVSSKPMVELSPSVGLRLSRVYWRCENEGHWTADAVLEEDTLKGRLSKHPVGVVVAGWLRMMAQNVLAVLRSLSRTDAKGTRPSWKETMEYVLVSYFDHALDTSRFDAVEV